VQKLLYTGISVESVTYTISENHEICAQTMMQNIKYYEYKDFHNIEKIKNGNVYRANWKNSEQYFILKSFTLDDIVVKEIINEVITKYNNTYFSFKIFTYHYNFID